MLGLFLLAIYRACRWVIVNWGEAWRTAVTWAVVGGLIIGGGTFATTFAGDDSPAPDRQPADAPAGDETARISRHMPRLSAITTGRQGIPTGSTVTAMDRHAKHCRNDATARRRPEKRDSDHGG